MIALLADLAPAGSIIIALVLAAWYLGRLIGALSQQVASLAAGTDSLVTAIEHLDRRLEAVERGDSTIPRRNHGARNQNPRHPEAP